MAITKFSELFDCRIKFMTSDGAYEGDVKIVSNSSEKMILQNCVCLLDNTRRVGTLIRSFKEVFDVEVIKQSRFKKRLSFEKRKMLYIKKTQTNHAKSSEMTAGDFNIPPSFGHLPSRIFTISSFGNELNTAIRDLKMSPVIGISLEGPNIGRYGLVHWLCAASRNGTYLFDLQGLGRKVFDFGLREILESLRIEKVIHDCRQVSDALYHLYDTKLSKVFDTQAAETVVNGDVNPLDICLQRHLNITEDYLPQPAGSISYPLKVKSSMIRPLGHHEMSIMIKNVIYLEKLRDELEQKCINLFLRDFETYRKDVASKSNKELRLNPHDAVRIPGFLLVEDKFRAVEYKETPHVPIDEFFNLPYTGQYSFVNKLNALRKQNPHSNAEDIRAKLPKVCTRRGPCHYPEPVCILGVESRIPSGKNTSDELNPRSRPSNSVGVVPDKNMVLSGEKNRAGKTGTSKNKDSESGTSPKNNKPVLSENVSSTEAETSKPSKVRIGNSRVLEYLRQQGVLIGSCSPVATKCSNAKNFEERVPSKDKENHCLETSSIPRCEKEGKTAQDSCDINTVQYNRDCTFCFLPRKEVSSSVSDLSHPWAALKSHYRPTTNRCRLTAMDFAE